MYDGRDSEPTFYCGHACQKADWGQHKSKCKRLQARKALGRAAVLLQAIIYRIRKHASPFKFTSVRVEGQKIYLHGYQIEGPGPLLKPFPACLDCDRSVAEAVLVYMGCTEAMMYLHGFAKELLTELCSRIEEVTISVTKCNLQISLVLPTGHHVPSAQHFHNIYRVTLHNGEVWAVDTTGAQYGYPDPLCPWRNFEQSRSGKIHRECEFGYIRHQAYQSSGKLPVRYMVVHTIEKRELAIALEEKIPAWTLEHGGKLNAIMRGSDAAFKQAKDKFIDLLENYLKASVIELYAPEQIRRRNIEVECQLSRNMANPEGQKSLDGLRKFMATAIATASGS